MQTDLHVSITHQKPLQQLPDLVSGRAWSIDGVYFAEAVSLTPAAQAVLAERHRQLTSLGWTPQHDDEHGDDSLARAAAAYVLADLGVPATAPLPALEGLPLWPWHPTDWKPKDRRSNLVRATALLLAEIERLDRATPPITPAPQPALF